MKNNTWNIQISQKKSTLHFLFLFPWYIFFVLWPKSIGQTRWPKNSRKLKIYMNIKKTPENITKKSLCIFVPFQWSVFFVSWLNLKKKCKKTPKKSKFLKKSLSIIVPFPLIYQFSKKVKKWSFWEGGHQTVNTGILPKMLLCGFYLLIYMYSDRYLCFAWCDCAPGFRHVVWKIWYDSHHFWVLLCILADYRQVL